MAVTRANKKTSPVPAFTLNAEQQALLFACRAAWEEGEGEERLERLRQREEDSETLRAVARLLDETEFAQGRDLTFAQMARLLALVRALAPNPNLDARLLRRPGEPAELNRDLRDLFFGTASAPLRLRSFLGRRSVGGQTATQLLCAVYPTEWPLITLTGLRALAITTEQQNLAIQEARHRFGLPAEPVADAAGGIPDTDPVLRLLSEVVIYERTKDALQVADFVETHRLLMHGLAAKPTRNRRRALSALLYAAPRPELTAPVAIREAEPPGYDVETSQNGLSETPAELSPAPLDIAPVSENAVLAYLEQWIAARGFTYPELTIRDYYLSLQARPFALLSGLSGTGKTRLTSLFAEALTGNPDAQYRLLPVRPDWADSTPLLGYVNLLASGGQGRFVSTPFLDFLLRASRPENANRAFFLCLDEMNLARVEHYFAEVLSAMETAVRELLLPDGRAIRLPANLFLIGTLNLDEATHSLSRKVLDRANTLSFQEVCLREEADTTSPLRAYEESLSPEMRQAVFLQTRLASVGAAREKLRQVGRGQTDFAARVVNALADANTLLEPHGLHFAYRIRDEVLRYCAQSFDRAGNGLLTPENSQDREANLQTALDLQVVQKVLPRLSGTQEQIAAPAADLLNWAEHQGFARSARKLRRLLARVQRDGFASFE